MASRYRSRISGIRLEFTGYHRRGRGTSSNLVWKTTVKRVDQRPNSNRANDFGGGPVLRNPARSSTTVDLRDAEELRHRGPGCKEDFRDLTRPGAVAGHRADPRRAVPFRQLPARAVGNWSVHRHRYSGASRFGGEGAGPADPTRVTVPSPREAVLGAAGNRPRPAPAGNRGKGDVPHARISTRFLRARVNGLRKRKRIMGPRPRPNHPALCPSRCCWSQALRLARLRTGQPG